MDLDRFRAAQAEAAEGYESALKEMRTTGKRSHWIWYVFPQLEGLGRSANSKFYALTDLPEATAYMKDPLLGARLLEIGSTVAERLRQGASLQVLMNSSVDVQKFVSSMTLFKGLAESAAKSGHDESLHRLSQVATEILLAANAEGFPPCRTTLDRLKISSRPKGYALSTARV